MKTLLAWTVLVFIILGHGAGEDAPCRARWEDAGQGYICVCNASYCDTIQTPEELPSGDFYWYSTSNSTPGFSRSTGTFLRTRLYAEDTEEVVFRINASAQYQKMVGFGASLTDSALLNINYLSDAAQEKVIQSYFGPDGIEYNIVRVPIGGTDFSTRVYTLDDFPYDEDLTHFSLSVEDKTMRIPFLKQAANMTQRGIKLMGCSWIAPSWMKVNDTDRRGFISNKYQKTWAQYHVRFLEESRKEGFEYWALSGGNEVMFLTMGSQMLSFLNFTLEYATAQRSWLVIHLRPALNNSDFGDVKFVTMDDERLFAPYWMQRFANHPDAYEAMDAIAVHAYSDTYTTSSLLDKLHEAYPDKMIMYTEYSINTGEGKNAVVLGSWERAEDYLKTIFEDLSHWSVTWLDWNIALGLDGGPSRSWGVDSPLIVNQTGDEFYKQPMFYALGHLSKFIHPGATRVQALSNQSTASPLDKEARIQGLQELLSTPRRRRGMTALPTTTPTVQCLAFSNPDNSTAVLVLNSGTSPVRVAIEDPRVGTALLTVEEQSINTIVYWS